MIAQTGSVYLTLCVSIERYVAVCLPLRARSICTFGRARCFVVLIGLFAVLYNVTRFLEVTWHTSFYSDVGNVTAVVSTDLRENTTYINVYITWMYLVSLKTIQKKSKLIFISIFILQLFMYFVPFSSLALFNLLIYHQVRSFFRESNSDRGKQLSCFNSSIFEKLVSRQKLCFFAKGPTCKFRTSTTDPIAEKRNRTCHNAHGRSICIFHL